MSNGRKPLQDFKMHLLLNSGMWSSIKSSNRTNNTSWPGASIWYTQKLWKRRDAASAQKKSPWKQDISEQRGQKRWRVKYTSSQICQTRKARQLTVQGNVRISYKCWLPLISTYKNGEQAEASIDSIFLQTVKPLTGYGKCQPFPSNQTKHSQQTSNQQNGNQRAQRKKAEHIIKIP